MKIIHIIIGLDPGGAEKQLYQWIINDSDNEHLVVSLTSYGFYGKKLVARGISVNLIDFRNLNILKNFQKLVSYLKYQKPDIVQTWMYHADLFGGLASRFSGCQNIFWAIRNTDIPKPFLSNTGFIRLLNGILSHFIPKKIICNSMSGLRAHQRLGYSKSKMVVIPNGYCRQIKKTNQTYNDIVKKYHLQNEHFVFGMVGRYDKLKGQDLFLSAIRHLAAQTEKKFLIVFVGRDHKKIESKISEICFEHSEKVSIQVLDHVENINEILSVFDVFCLPSISEGFPNALVEAMLMGKPCIASLVGDVEDIIADPFQQVVAGKPSEFAQKMYHFMNMSHNDLLKLGNQNREKIQKNYDLAKMRKGYLTVYQGKEK